MPNLKKKKKIFSLQVPNLSWYHAAFDTEPDIPSFNTDPRKIYTDFKACRWPPDLDPLTLNDGGDALAKFFDSLNDPQLASLARSLKSAGDRSDGRNSRPVVIAFSHFLPFLELLPEKRFVYAPNLAKVAGSTLLGERVANLRPDVLVFGHTHIPFDGPLPPTTATSLPTRFVQAPLRYPAERRRSREGRGGGDGSGSPTSSRSYQLQLIWDCGEEEESESGGESGSDGEEVEARAQKITIKRGKAGPTREAFWTRYYEENARDPANLELAPWVRPRVERYKNL